MRLGGVAMKIQLDQVVVTSVEADLPTVCPRCGTDLTADGALEEQQLCFGSQACAIVGDVVDDHDATESGDCAYVTGFRCGHCREDLVSEKIEEHQAAAQSQAPADEGEARFRIESIRAIEGEAALLGIVYIFGILHHAWFIRVEERDGEQVPVDDPHGRLDEFHQLDADRGPMQTVDVPGHPGEYVLVIYPAGQ
jgi:hypothetical protein